MAIDWDSIEKQAAEKSAALRRLDGRTAAGTAPAAAQPVSLPMVRSVGTSALDGFGASLAKSTLSMSPTQNAAVRSALLPMRQQAASVQDAPTAARRIGSGVKSIGQTLAATPLVLGEALKADLDATTKARQERGEFSSTFDVDPDTFGKAAEPSGFDIDPDTVEQNPNAGSGKYQRPLDPNSIGMRMMGKAMESREEAVRGMSGVPKFLAETGLSIGQNAVLLPTAVISPAIPLAAMGAQSAAQKTYELTAQGKNAGEALGRGIVSGSIEAATEKLPLDTLADLVKTGGKGVVRNLLKQAGVEAAEEGVSYAANFIADKAAQDPNAKFDVKELLQSAAAGGLSGLFFGGVGTAVNKAVTLPMRKTARNVETLPMVTQDSVSRNDSAVTLPMVNQAQEAVTDAPAQQKTASTVETGRNTRLSEKDLDEYLATGKTGHTRNKKARLLESGKSPILTTISAVRDYISSAIRGDSSGEVRGYGKVGADFANAVKQVDPSVDIDGYYLELDADSLRHAYLQHEHAKQAGDIGLSQQDFLNIPEYVDNFDYILSVENYNGKKKIRLGKKINGYSVILETVSKERNSLQVLNMIGMSTDKFVDKYKNQIRDAGSQGGTSTQTVNTTSLPTDGVSNSDPTIPQQEQGVKTQDMQQEDGVSENISSGFEGAGIVSTPTSESSVGAATYGFDPWSNFQNQKSEFFPDGANAARPVDVPTTDPEGRRVRKTSSTAMGAKGVTDEAVVRIQEMVLNGDLSFDRNTDAASIARAEKTIRDKDFDGAMEYFSSAVNKGVVSKDLATVGQQLLVNAANAGDLDSVARVLSLYAQMETAAGQAVQAASILRKLPATAQLYAIRKTVADLEGQVQKRYHVEVKVSPELEADFNAQTDQAGRDAVMEKIYDDVASKVPANWMDKWNAWRYLSMLANPRTNIRNIAGNVGFQPLRMTKDAVAAAIEAAASAVTGGKVERTKAFTADPALYRAAWDDWGSVKDTLSQGGKYNEATGEIESRRKIFTLPVLEKARTGNAFLLEAEDAVFKRITYADALAKFLKANGVTAEQFQSGQVGGTLLTRARDYAGKEALKATFQDRNAVSDLVSKLGRYSGDNPAAKGLSVLAEGVLPFRRTPANILVRGVEYSPLGLAKSLTADLYKVGKGEMSAAQAIDNIAAGATGTALFGLGALLLSMGLVTPGKDDDEKQAALDDLTGKQAYALQLPDGTSYTLDWMAPEALPFFMGVELADNWLKEGFTVDALTSALASVSEPMLEMSMLQSVNDLLDSIKYAKSSGNLAGIVQSALTSYLTQAIPTLGGQIERTAEDKRMTTYTDKNLLLPTDVQYAVGKASARLPGMDYQQIPYIDAWGREQEAEPLPIRAAENFLSPGYVSVRKQTEADKEVQRLYSATGDGKVVPTRAAKYVQFGGERKDLSKEEYITYATTKGQTAYQIVDALISNRDYLSMEDTDKADAIAKAYEYANAVGKAAVSDYQPDGWVKKAIDGQIDPALYILYKASADADGNHSVTQAEAESAIRRLPVSQEQKAYLWQSQNVKWKAEKNPFG